MNTLLLDFNIIIIIILCIYIIIYNYYLLCSYQLCKINGVHLVPEQPALAPCPLSSSEGGVVVVVQSPSAPVKLPA